MIDIAPEHLARVRRWRHRPWSTCSRSRRPASATAATWPTTGTSALVVDPQRDIDRITDPGRGARRAHHPRGRDPHAQRLRQRRPRALAQAAGAQLSRQRRRPGRASPAPGAGTATPCRSRRPCATCPGHARAYLHPLVLRARDGGRGSRGLHRWVTAVRLDRRGRTCSGPDSTPALWPARSTHRRTGWPVSCPTRPRSSRPTASGASARPPSRRRAPPRSAPRNGPIRRSRERAGLRRGAARRPGRLARLLRAHGGR